MTRRILVLHASSCLAAHSKKPELYYDPHRIILEAHHLE